MEAPRGGLLRARGAAWGHVAALVVAAAWLRLRNLDTLGLYGDEDLTALAVDGFLRHGLPLLPSGMEYWRAFPYTLLAAASAWLIGIGETALRLPSALCGVATIPLFHVLARRLVGPASGAFAAWLLALSGWHIDMSREARMYAPFLLCFVAALLAFQLGLSQRRQGLIIAGCLAGTLAGALHELGLLVLPFLWLAAFLSGELRRRPLMLGTVTLALGGFGVLYSRWVRLVPPGPVAGRGPAAGAAEPLAAEWIEPLVRTFHIQVLPSLRAVSELATTRPVVWAVGAVGAMALALWAFRLDRLRPAVSHGRLAIWIALPIALAAALNLFGAVLTALGGLALLWPERTRAWLRVPSWGGILLAGLAAALFLAWQVFGLATWAAGRPIPASLVAVLRDALYWPAIPLVLYIEAFPVMTTVVAAVSALWLVRGSRAGEPPGGGLALAALWFWFPLAMLGFTHRWLALRYTLPVYPAYLVLAAWALLLPARWLAIRLPALAAPLAAPLLATLLLTVPWANEEHGLLPALRWSSLEFRQPVQPLLHGFAFHPDHRGAAQHLRENLAPGDRVVAMDVQQMRFNAGQADFWLMETENARRFAFIDGKNWRDIYTAAVVVDDAERLAQLIEEAVSGPSRLWVVTSGELTGKMARAIPRGVHELLEAHADRVAFLGRDDATRVLFFE